MSRIQGPQSGSGSTLFQKAKSLLDSGRHDDALAALRNQAHADPWLRNLMGVCLLRSNRPEDAVELYRTVVWSGNGISLRDDIPIEFKTNFATGLLLLGRV